MKEKYYEIHIIDPSGFKLLEFHASSIKEARAKAEEYIRAAIAVEELNEGSKIELIRLIGD